MKSLLIRGGRVIDPASGVDRLADVLIRFGRVEAIGHDLSAEGVPRFDARGGIVAPAKGALPLKGSVMARIPVKLPPRMPVVATVAAAVIPACSTVLS